MPRRGSAGPGPGARRPPRSPPRRRPRDRGERGGRGRGRLFSAPFSSGFWAARRGPLPAGVGSGRATPGAGRGARGPGRPQGAGGAGPGLGVGGRAAGVQASEAGPCVDRAGAASVPGAGAPEGAGPPGSPVVQGTRSSGGVRPGAPELGCPRRGTPDVPSGVRGVTEVGEDWGLLSACGRRVRAAFQPRPGIPEPPSLGFEGPFCGSRGWRGVLSLLGGWSWAIPGNSSRSCQAASGCAQGLAPGIKGRAGGGKEDGEVRG